MDPLRANSGTNWTLEYETRENLHKVTITLKLLHQWPNDQICFKQLLASDMTWEIAMLVIKRPNHTASPMVPCLKTSQKLRNCPNSRYSKYSSYSRIVKVGRNWEMGDTGVCVCVCDTGGRQLQLNIFPEILDQGLVTYWLNRANTTKNQNHL